MSNLAVKLIHAPPSQDVATVVAIDNLKGPGVGGVHESTNSTNGTKSGFIELAP